MKHCIRSVGAMVAGTMLGGAVATQAGPAGSAEQRARTARSIQRWQGWRFGMFVHWGPVSLKGTEISWSRQGPRRGHRGGGTGTIPMEEYDNLYKHFNPVKFNAAEWVRIAQDAGMRYLVFTSKHHDGFCEFDTRYTNYRITAPESPYGRDVCAQLADAAHRHGLPIGWYYSPRDWHHPDFATVRHAQYLKYYLGQLRELCAHYGRIDILWFDGLDSPRGLWGNTPQQSMDLIRRLQPDIILNNRGGLPGDFDTPEQRIGGFNRARPWETCMTLCRQWAWKPNDRMKSFDQCIQTLLKTAGGDGNLLLNVGPMPDGRIEPRQVQRLKEIGAWLREFGEGVYHTRGGPFKPGRWGASTCHDHQIYLFVMAPADEKRQVRIELPAVKETIASIAGLNVKSDAISWRQDDRGIKINYPRSSDGPADVLILELNGPALRIEPVEVHVRENG